MAYYHDLITEQSWQELIQLKKLIPFVLIGGWATYLYTKSLKSKDIDIIIDYPVLSRLKVAYDIRKNDRLHKYEAVKGPVQIDIYLPHYSKLGIPAEEIMTHSRTMEGFTVVSPNTLFTLKMITLVDRGRTPKGRKDFLDLLAITKSQTIDYQSVIQLLTIHNQLSAVSTFKTFLDETTHIQELNLNTHSYAKLKKQIQF